MTVMESRLEIYQVRFKRKARDILSGRETPLHDCDIRYVVGENQHEAQVCAEDLRRGVERSLNANGHKYTCQRASCNSNL